MGSAENRCAAISRERVAETRLGRHVHVRTQVALVINDGDGGVGGVCLNVRDT